jgi:hypothetical protein
MDRGLSDPEVQMFGLQRMWCLESECEPFNVTFGLPRGAVFWGIEDGVVNMGVSHFLRSMIWL